MTDTQLNYSIVEKDENCGYGVISNRNFIAGEKIGDMRGVIRRRISQHSLQVKPGQHIVDLKFAGFLLHSCDPNVSVDMKNLVVTAKTNISKNEYLYMDYSETEDVLYKQFQCQCGSNNCRGWIVGRKEMYPHVVAKSATKAKTLNP